MVFVCRDDHPLADRASLDLRGLAAIAGLVGNGLGTAFMPRSEAGRVSQLRSVELADLVMWQVYRASPARDRLRPATTRLADALCDAAAEARTQ